MTTRTVTTEAERALLVRYIGEQKLPFTVAVTKGIKRTAEQNRLQRMWINEISEQRGDMTPEEVRAECKLTLGVPILRAENERFCAEYDRVIKPLFYEEKLRLMMEPLDFPVSRLMTTAQHSKYLDAIFMHYAGKGFVLTDPERVAA
jgi:hypothetical protein